DLVDAALRHDDVLSIIGRLDVANDATAARNDPALELAGRDIEADEHVGFDRRLDVPDRTVQIRDAVRLRLRSTRRGPFRDLPRPRVEASEVAARVVRVPDDVVRADRDAAGAAVFVRQRVLLYCQRFRIDLDDLVGAEVAYERYAGRGEHHAVGVRALGW